MLGLGVGIPKLVYPAPAGYVNAQSLSLDGTGDAVNPFSEADLQTTLRGSYTISMWVKVAYDSSFYLFGYTDSGSAVAGGVEFQYTYFNPSVDVITITQKLGGFNGTAIQLINPSFTDASNTWQNIVYVVSAGPDGSTAGTHTLFVNGSQIDQQNTLSKTYSDATTVTSGRGFLLGARDNNGTAESHMTGLIDEVGIWNTALPANAVTAVYNSGVPFDLTGNKGDYGASHRLNRYYRFEGTSTEIKQDSSGNNNGSVFEGDPTGSTDVPS
tara:strand:- start:3616 stop:4425 length:810 start_codon:yes stop_codon:yes gene_type:complete